MEENPGTMQEQPADQQDAFLAGWDDEPDATATADQPDDQAEDPAAAEGGNPGTGADDKAAEDPKDDPAADKKTDTQPSTPADQPEGAQQPQQWTVKHMGEEKTVSVGEITPELLQKGLDYDRVRGKYDEAKPVMEMFSEFAKNAGMSVPDYAKFLRSEAKKASGMSEADAKRAVELEDREAAIAAAEAARQEERSVRERETARVQQDVNDFARAFPDIYEKAKTDPKAIPESVWNDVKTNKIPLTAAYSKYAVAQATADAAAAKAAAATAANNAGNAARSTGSMHTAGNQKKTSDAFLDGWDS